MDLLALPPELLISVLEGFSVQDVVNVAQTCSRLRAIVSAHKSSLFNTSNRHSLQLPLGSTFDELSPEDLYAYAAKSVAISERLSTFEPLHDRSQVLYTIPSPKFVWSRDDPPANFFIRDIIVAFRCHTSILIFSLGDGDLIEEIAEVDLEPDSDYQIVYQLSEREDSLIVAWTAGKEDEGRAALHVQEISIQKDRFGEIIYSFQIGFPDITPDSISVRDPYVAVVTNSDCLLVEWRKKTGIVFEMPDPRAIEETDDDVSYGRETIDDITTVLFHPAKAIMIVVEAWTNDGVGSGIYEADIPSDMPLLVHGMSVDIVHWSCREIKPREIPRSIFPFRQGFDGGMLPMGFRALSDSTWVLDVVIVGEYVNLECREPDDKQSLIVSRVSFDLSDWSQTSDFLEYSLADPQETNFLPHGNHRLAGSAFFILLESNRCQIVAPKFGNGNGHAMGWVQLDVPPALSIRVPAASYKMRPDGEDWKAVVSAFDMKMGKLYICLPDGLHVLQY